MSLVFPRRCMDLERMDLEPMNPATAARVFGDLETINHVLGGVCPTLWHLRRASARWTRGETIRLLDWGTGGADVPRAIIRWARRRGFRLQITGIDQDPETAAYADRMCRTYPEIRIVKADARTFPAEAGSFDYVLSSLTLHHLTDQDIVELLRKSDHLARRGVIMNDLHRSSRAWAWIWALSRLARAHPMVCHDGPLSVRRAFSAEELAGYARQAELPYLRVRRHFGHRFTLAGEKS